MKKIFIFILLVLLLTFGATPVYANGIPALPHAFYGSVLINGAAAPSGTQVSATVDNGTVIPIQNPVSTVGGEYGANSPMLLVQGDGLSGAITFYVNDYEATPSQAATFVAGGGPDSRALSVTIPPTIGYSPSIFSFAATVGGANPPSQTLSISNTGINPTAMAWSVSDNAPWLNLSPASGSSSVEVDSLIVSVSISGMSAGSYSGTITISGPEATNTPQTVAVTLALAAPPTPPPAGGGGPAPPPPGTTDVRGIVSTEGVFLRPVPAISEDGLCTLTIPAGTVGLTEELEPITEITMLIMDDPPPPPEEGHVIGLAYDFQPSGATFEPPITLTFSYDPANIPEGVAEGDLVLAFYIEGIPPEPGEWIELEGCVVDPVTHTITASVSHFTTFAIIGAVPPPPPAPAAFSLSNLTAHPAEVQPGEAVTVAVSVANTGGTEGSYTVVLKINGVKETEKSVIIAAGSSEIVTFSVTKEDVASYSVTVDGLSGSFTVVAPVVAPLPAAFSVSNLSIQPAEVPTGEEVRIDVAVTNTGGTEGSYTIVLKINGVKEADKTLTIAAGGTLNLIFLVTKEDAGSYSVTVDGLSGSFTVVVPAVVTNWPLLGGIIGAVVVVALLVFFLVFRRRAY